MSRLPHPDQPRKPEENAVNENTSPGMNRRALLKGGLGAIGAGVLGGALLRPSIAGAAFARPVPPSVNNPAAPRWAHLAATDGWVSMPGNKARPPFWPDPLAPTPYNTYAFGFRDVAALFDQDGAGNTVVGSDGYPVIQPANQAKLDALKGKAQISAPIYTFKQDDEVRISLDNLGLLIRPDLVDGHTMHWHGFNNAIPLFDGVPELSIAVPIGRRFVYEYRPRDAGTFMYHCHFEDVEHVQMGMTGILYVRPAQNADAAGIPAHDDGYGAQQFDRFAYNCGDGSTGYHREYSLLLTELWPEAHYRDAHIQVTDWTDFNAAFWLLNGRAYPDTLDPNGSWDDAEADLASSAGRLRYNPNGSLVRANEGERVLLRMSNLGYQVHTMTLEGAAMRVVAKDASLLRGKQTGGGTVDLSYRTSGVEIGPGESRDVIFRAPAHSGAGEYDTYLLYDRNFSMRNNNGASGNGGQMTEVRVYPAGTVGPQSLDAPNS